MAAHTENLSERLGHPAEHDTDIRHAASSRWMSLLGGGALALYGIRRGSLGGALLALTGGAVLYHGVTGRWPAPGLTKRIAVTSGEEIKVSESVIIQQPVEAVYRYWRQLENLPRFMQHLQSVEQMSDGRSRWRVKVPGTDFTIEWQAQITEDRENELLAWRSLPDAAVFNEGQVRFAPLPDDRGTEVQATILYRPPGGSIGGAVARLFSALPAQFIREDLRRFKQAMEASELPTMTGQR
jgi:uncharacterized membrane protein